MLFIIGASGTIGSHLLKMAVKYGENVIGTSYSKHMTGLKAFDMRADNLEMIAPDLSERDCVYLLAGHTNPNWIFENPTESSDLNVDAAIRTIDQVEKQNAKLIYVSTELVFSGERGGYTEADAVSPTTVYGKQKAIVEQYIRQSSKSWNIVRTGAIVTHQVNTNCPVEKTYKTLLGEGAMMARDNVFTLTDIEDICSFLLSLPARSASGVFHVVSSPSVNRVELADCIIRSSRYGKRMSYRPGLFKDIPYPELRPKSAWLSNKKISNVYNMTFKSPLEAVTEKVKLIDDLYSDKEDKENE